MTLKTFNNASIDVSCKPTLKAINVDFKPTSKAKFFVEDRLDEAINVIVKVWPPSMKKFKGLFLDLSC